MELTRDGRETAVVAEEDVLTPADRVDASRLPTLLLGIMQWAGLIVMVSNAFVAMSTPETFGLLAFPGVGLVNFFVPSGGGQFAVLAIAGLKTRDILGYATLGLIASGLVFAASLVIVWL